jgi:hypothetical protein
VNAFRSGLENADSFDKRSLSSMQSQYSMHTVRSTAAFTPRQLSNIGADDAAVVTSSPSRTTSSHDDSRVRV